MINSASFVFSFFIIIIIFFFKDHDFMLFLQAMGLVSHLKKTEIFTQLYECQDS